MNRPFGAVDVSANLKGSVPKTATQKILLALADKGEVTQKVYGESLAFLIQVDVYGRIYGSDAVVPKVWCAQ